MTLSRPSRRTAVIGGALLAFAVLLAGFLAATPQGTEIVYAAACKASNGYCPPDVRTSAIDVTHVVPGGGATDTPVEPDDGESWSITAYWNDTVYPCSEHYETATVDVSWSGTAWVLSNKSTTTNITDIQICNEDTCAEVDTHSYGYRMYVELNDDLALGTTHHLRQVVYTTTAVDDGAELDASACTLGTSVTPDSQTFSATDSGSFECYYSCDNAGTSIRISY